MEINTKNFQTKEYWIIKEAFENENLLNEFENKFLKSIYREDRFHFFESNSCYEGRWQKNYSNEEKPNFHLSEKQTVIYLRIIDRFRRVSLKAKYEAYFKVHKIELSEFDKAYLSTYSDEYKETEHFNNWLKLSNLI